MADKDREERRDAPARDRREFFSRASSLAMFAGLTGGYGAFAYFAGRFLYPAQGREMGWMYVVEAGEVQVGDTLLYEAPSGETINVTRQTRSGTAEDFIALSSTCPHLGCQVHWEAGNNQYFCPCHNGVFDPSGKGIAGPPGDAGQSLLRYRVKIEGGLLYMEVPLTSIAEAGEQGHVIEKVEGIHGPGHDPCLASRHTPGCTTPGGSRSS